MRKAALSLMICAALTFTSGCVRYVYLPEDAAYYHRLWVETLFDKQDLRNRLEECKREGEDLRRNCD